MTLQGYLTALLGNIMLLNYFLGRKKRSGATIQAVGIATNVIVLTQVETSFFATLTRAASHHCLASIKPP